ncbi:glycosyltransferase family 4 protein [Lichenihabitans psoromatis]|uniref:glycosyltransferase family 4 protein n=1 Tax=Lichenihabitans psoromatis TaxID=2528642 RepID=UPI001035861F|nr:glycosyltransferase family 1 protein [Lichenihabitans psoromatis]
MFKGLRANTAHRSAGDAARDRRDWYAAERSYRQHLDLKPQDAAIWVQLGHTVKEQGHYAQAAIAYRRAVDLLPDDAEVWLHLAHALLRDGQDFDAMTAFERNHELSGGREGYDYALSLGAKASPLPEPDRAVTTFLLLDDLFKFLTAHVTLSGIQRTQVGIISNLLLNNEDEFQYLVTSDDHSHASVTFWEMSTASVKDLVQYVASGNELKRTNLDHLLKNTKEHSRRARFKRDDIVFIPGAFWIIEQAANTFGALNMSGVKIGVYIYDLIPISHPEFCAPSLVEMFARSFTAMIQFVDFFATISDYVARVLAEFIETYHLRPIPITSIPLAHFLTIPDASQKASDFFLRTLTAKIQDRHYVLYVSTIEGRKNHLYILNVWQELIRRNINMPDLIFLGREGWRIEGLRSFLDGTHNLDGRVHFMHDVGDGDLAHLYRNADFTVFTSLVEGWGLPVGESLVFGKPCVASNNCSIPEVGGDLVDYVDPLNIRDGIAVVERMVTVPSYRKARERAIAEFFKPRTWAEVGDRFVQLIKLAHSTPSASRKPFQVLPGRNYSLLKPDFLITDLGNLLQYPIRFLLHADFYEQERHQVWMRGTSGVIEIPTTFEPGSVVTVAVELVIPSWNRRGRFAISPLEVDDFTLKQSAAIYMDRAGVPLVATVNVPVNEVGQASVRISVINPTPHIDDDGREFYIGIRSLTYCEAGSGSTRHSMLASFLDEAPFSFHAVSASPSLTKT